MIRQDEKWKAFIVKNQTHYNKTNESKFNLIALTPEERGWTELFQIYPPKTRTGGSGTSPINGRSYSWTYGFLPVGYFGVKNQSRVFTSSGTWTCPDGVKEIYVRCIAPGGAGSNGQSNAVGKGGGGGGFIMAKISTTPGNNYAVSISSGLTSFGGVLTATAGNSGANGGTGGNFTHTETPTILFTGTGGDGNRGGGGGGSELGKGGNGGYGGGGLHSSSVGYGGGGGMLGSSSYAGAGFKSPDSNDTGGGMFSSTGIKKTSSPYYDKLSAEITENLGNWGSPGNYGGGGAKVMFSGAHAGTRGKSDTESPNATAGGNAGYGGFGGGGGGGGDGGGTAHNKPAANAGNGGAGGYGGGGGAGGMGGGAVNNNVGAGGAGSPGGAGGGGGFGGNAGGMYGSSPIGNAGGNGGAGGYGGGGGGGGFGKDRGNPGRGGSGGAGLVIIEW